MLNNPAPLSIAAGVLADTTLECVRHSPSFHLRGWQILDRWAFESPGQLQRFEGEPAENGKNRTLRFSGHP